MSRDSVALEPPDGSPEGFALSPPRGTCYLALDVATAIRETVGAALSTSGVISAEFAERRQLSRLAVPHEHRLTDTAADANAVALFAEEGEANWPTEPEPLTAAARRAGLTVASPPRSVRIVSAPTR